MHSVGLWSMSDYPVKMQDNLSQHDITNYLAKRHWCLKAYVIAIVCVLQDFWSHWF